jgi:hypothetical protein
MGVYIKDIEMPKDCDALLHIRPDGRAVLYPFNGTDEPREFTAVPVPPHGRCVDADRMLADNEIYYNQLGRPDGAVGARYQSVKRSIELASTIIPAEEEPNVPDP